MTPAERLEHMKRLFVERPAGWQTRELAAYFQEQPRTIQRDLARLQAEPHRLPLIREGRCWRLMEGHAYTLPPLFLTLHDAVALYLAARLLARYSDEHNPHSVAALNQLAAVLPEAAGRLVRRSAESLRYRLERPRVTQVLEAVAEGWMHHRQVRVRYYGADESPESARETILHPYLLEPSSWGLATYVIGYSSRHVETRTFKVERFLAAEVLANGFPPPALDPIDLLSSAWNVMYGDTLEKVVLRFSPAVAWRVRESVWHPSQVLAVLPDGGYRVTFTIAHPTEMKPWIRQRGGDVFVESPAWLRVAIATEMRRAAAQYDQEV